MKHLNIKICLFSINHYFTAFKPFYVSLIKKKMEIELYQKKNFMKEANLLKKYFYL